MKHADIAEKTFKDGFICSQSVLSAYASELSLPEDIAYKIANGFGGGMGRKQEVCGAVCGAVMVIGLVCGRGKLDGKDKHEKTYLKVQQFFDAFVKIHGSVNCKELLSGCCLLTEEGRKLFHENKLIEKCYKYVRTSCDILDRIIESPKQ